MKRLRSYLRVARLLLVIGLGLFVASTFGLLERLHIARLMYHRQRWTRWYMRRLSAALPFRVKVKGQLPQQPMLWVGNHVSWTDIALLGQLAPLSFLSKAEVRSWPVAGWLALKAGTLFIRRGSGDSQLIKKQMTRHLQQGHHLLIFPEGTSTDGKALRTFHGRLLGSAAEAGVAVQPVAIQYLRDGQIDTVAPFIGDDDLLSHLLRLFAHDRSEVHIQLLQPIPSEGLERAALALKAQQAVHQALFGLHAPQPERRPVVKAQAAA